jgi:hypothetical protein
MPQSNITSSSTLNWELLRKTSHFVLRRCGRYLIGVLIGEHLVLSTSVRNGGQERSICYLGNHQSCEGTAHVNRQTFIKLGPLVKRPFGNKALQSP